MFFLGGGLRDGDPAGVQPLANHLERLDRLRGGQEGVDEERNHSSSQRPELIHSLITSLASE